MTRIAKLYTRAVADPAGMSFRDLERLLEAFGFKHRRTVGSHRQYVHPKVSRPLPVQPDRKHAKRYQVEQFLGMIEQFELSIDQ